MTAPTSPRVTDFRQMLGHGIAVADEIKDLADLIAKKMERVHGGEWRVHIDHEHQFIMVRAI